MKSYNKIISVILAAGSTSVALLTLSGQLSADIAFATLSVVAIGALANHDYSRSTASLRTAAPVIRPTARVDAQPSTGLANRHAA